MKKILKNQKGVTLIELLIVMVIIIILLAIAAPKFSDTAQRARETAFDSQVRTLSQAAEIHILMGGGDAIWAARAGDKAQETITGQHETWYSILTEWPENVLGTGDFVVEIKGDSYTVSPDSY